MPKILKQTGVREKYKRNETHGNTKKILKSYLFVFVRVFMCVCVCSFEYSIIFLLVCKKCAHSILLKTHFFNLYFLILFLLNFFDVDAFWHKKPRKNHIFLTYHVWWMMHNFKRQHIFLFRWYSWLTSFLLLTWTS